MYTVRFTPTAAQEIRQLPKNVKHYLREQLEKVVCVNPTECSEELTGPLADFRSYHLDDYRVIYRILDCHQLVAVVGIGKKNADHYAEIYKNLENMARAGKLAEGMLDNLRMLNPH